MTGEENRIRERFEVVYEDRHSAGIVFVDRETGVNYLFVQMGYAGGLTPLLDADGKPVVTQKLPSGGEKFGKE